MKIKVDKYLRCGCCGFGFRTWKGYQDQDQDNGYGICVSCQRDNREHDRNEMTKAIDTIENSLNKSNKNKMNIMTREQKELVVWKALNDGILTFGIKRSTP